MNKEIPLADWPAGDMEGIGKVIQVYVDDKPYLRFMSTFFATIRHKDILERFLDDLCIQVDYHDDLPPSEGDRYKVVGMGHYEVDRSNKHLIQFSGSSIDYNLRIDPKHLSEIEKLQQEWTLRTRR